MTQNQIKWLEHLENKRHNLESEREAAKHNRATEGVESGKLAETTRHNYISEAQNWRNLDISAYTARETQKHYARQDEVNLMNAKTNLLDVESQAERRTNQSRIEMNQYNRQLAADEFSRTLGIASIELGTLQTQASFASALLNAGSSVLGSVIKGEYNMKGIIQNGQQQLELQQQNQQSKSAKK